MSTPDVPRGTPDPSCTSCKGTGTFTTLRDGVRIQCSCVTYDYSTLAAAEADGVGGVIKDGAVFEVHGPPPCPACHGTGTIPLSAGRSRLCPCATDKYGPLTDTEGLGTRITHVGSMRKF